MSSSSRWLSGLTSDWLSEKRDFAFSVSWKAGKLVSPMEVFKRRRRVSQDAYVYSLPLPVEHRSMQFAYHLFLFRANFLISFLVKLAFDASLSTVLLRLFLGRPWFLFPCGFYLSASLVTLLFSFLRVCPIQPHLHLLIWRLISSGSVLAHQSSFLWYTEASVCPWCTVSFCWQKTTIYWKFQRTDFTLVLHIRSFVFLDIT